MKNYKIELEIFEGKGGELKKVDGKPCIPPDLPALGICAWLHWGDGEHSLGTGKRFSLPEDRNKICPWLLASIDPMVNALSSGETLGWTYRGTPYEKTIDPDGVTTEFVRCPDPTASGIVVKIIRTALKE